MGDVLPIRTEAQINSEYTMNAAQLGDAMLRLEAHVNHEQQKIEGFKKKAIELSQEIDKLRAEASKPAEVAPEAPAPIPDITA